MDDGYNSIFSFLKVALHTSVFEKKFIGKEGEGIDKKTFNLLKSVYKEQNEKLFNLLGFKISEWN